MVPSRSDIARWYCINWLWSAGYGTPLNSKWIQSNRGRRMVHKLLHENKYLFEQRYKWFYLALSTVSTRRDCTIRGGTFVILQTRLSTTSEITVVVFVDNSDHRLPYTIFSTRRGARIILNRRHSNVASIGITVGRSRLNVRRESSDRFIIIHRLVGNLKKKIYVKSTLLHDVYHVSATVVTITMVHVGERWGERIKTPTLKRMHPLPTRRRHADPGRDR